MQLRSGGMGTGACALIDGDLRRGRRAPTAKMDYYLSLMPPQLPWHRGLVIVSGIAEIVLGIAVLVPATRVWAAWGLVALLVAVFPANVYGAFAHVPHSGGYARLPLQAVFIAWAWWYTRP